MCLHLLLHALQAGLPSRFPRVTQLHLVGGVKRPDGSSGQCWAEFAKIVMGGAWRGVTSLQLGRLAGYAAMAAISSCPNTMQCKLGPDHSSSCSLADSLCHASRALQKLTSLACTNSLGDEELQALAGCASLASLDLKLGDCSQTGWASMQQLTRLESLHLTFKPSTLPADALASWSASFTALTSLVLVGKEKDAAITFDDGAAFSAPLRLPTSLVCLRLQGRALPLPLSGLPRLTVLELTWGFVLDDAGLRRIAQACPQLASVAVSVLDITPACHSEPLAGVCAVRVYSECVAALHTRIGKVFPNVSSISIACNCKQLEAGVHVFEGANALEYLDMGHSPGCRDGPYLALKASDYAVLAALPQLLELRLNATPEHVQGLCAMSRLQGATFVCSLRLCSEYAALNTAFTTYCAPDQLYLASFEFLDICASTSLFHLASSVQLWLLQSIMLTHVEWRDEKARKNAPGLINDIGLYALAAHPNIIHIKVTGGDISAAMVQRVQHMHAASSLQVVVGQV